MFPASKDLQLWLDKNIIQDCKLERRDFSAANDIFGSDVAILQGKTTCKQASNALIALPRYRHLVRGRHVC
jgi:hypothetical protein